LSIAILLHCQVALQQQHQQNNNNSNKQQQQQQSPFCSSQLQAQHTTKLIL